MQQFKLKVEELTTWGEQQSFISKRQLLLELNSEFLALKEKQRKVEEEERMLLGCSYDSDQLN